MPDPGPGPVIRPVWHRARLRRQARSRRAGWARHATAGFAEAAESRMPTRMPPWIAWVLRSPTPLWMSRVQGQQVQDRRS